MPDRFRILSTIVLIALLVACGQMPLVDDDNENHIVYWEDEPYIPHAINDY